MKFSSFQVMILLTQFSIASGNCVLAADSLTSPESAVKPANTGVSINASGTSAESTTTTSSTPGAPEKTSSSPDSKPASRGEYDDVKIQKNFIHSSTIVTSTNCKIKCLDPHAETEESAEVIDILQKIYKAYAEKDLDYIGKHLAQDCITFYEGDKKVISGKQAALDDIKEWTDKESKNTDSPLLEIILEHPYCNINQGNAVITFTAIKEVGGKHPVKSKSHCNDVFKKDGDNWLLLTHYRSSWKDLN